jgi:hypothetical protein
MNRNQAIRILDSLPSILERNKTCAAIRTDNENMKILITVAQDSCDALEVLKYLNDNLNLPSVFTEVDLIEYVKTLKVGMTAIDLTAEENGWPDQKGVISNIDGSMIEITYESGNKRWKKCINVRIIK